MRLIFRQKKPLKGTLLSFRRNISSVGRWFKFANKAAYFGNLKKKISQNIVATLINHRPMHFSLPLVNRFFFIFAIVIFFISSFLAILSFVYVSHFVFKSAILFLCFKSLYLSTTLSSFSFIKLRLLLFIQLCFTSLQHILGLHIS